MAAIAKVVRALLRKGTWRSAPQFSLTDSKFRRILELCEGKDVLDCGCVGSRVEDPGDIATTSHYHIASVARHCVGVDIQEDEVKKRRKAGYDVRRADVETMDLGETFDVIVAADLIEHVSNAGRFLDRAHGHLRNDGFLCLVTPNAASANVVCKSLLGVESRVNPEHTCWYDPITIQQLLERHNFEPVEWYWQDYGKVAAVRIVTRLLPNLAAHFVVIARKREGGAK